MRNPIAILPVVLIAGSLVACIEKPATKEVSFSKDVKPILDRNCVVCHSPGRQGYDQSGLSMESYESLLKGTRTTPVINPGRDFSSTLIVVITAQAGASLHMPHYQESLPKEQIDTIRTWINQGAKDN